jgi:peptide/nickel transport system substrate-binding protein
VLHVPDVAPENVAEFIAASLTAVGIDVGLQRIDLVHLFGVKVQPSYDLLLSSFPGPSGIGPYGDPDMMRGVYHSKPPNQLNKATGYSNPEVDRLLDAQLATDNVDDRKRIVGQIQRLVAEDLPVAMLYYTTGFHAYRKSVFDQWYYTPGGFGPGIGEAYNKHAYVTGNREGLKIRD